VPVQEVVSSINFAISKTRKNTRRITKSQILYFMAQGRERQFAIILRETPVKISTFKRK
jgi:hypothetical protein